MAAPDAFVEVLSREECLRLLSTVPVAWLAWADGDRVEAVPVNYVVHEGRVVARTSYGGKLAAAAHEVPMTVAVDTFDATTRTGWSVVVRGRAEVLAHADDLDSLDLPPVDTWAPGERGFFVGIAVQEVSGRRIATPAAAAEHDLRD